MAQANFHLLMLIAVSCLAVPAKAESWSTGDPNRLYGVLHLHPKQFSGARSENGWVRVEYRDGTSELIAPHEYDAQKRDNIEAQEEYFRTPSQENFLRLSLTDKLEVVVASLSGGPIYQGKETYSYAFRDARIPSDAKLRMARDENLRSEYSTTFSAIGLSYLNSLSAEDQQRLVQFSLNSVINTATERALPDTYSILSKLVTQTARGDDGKIRQLACESLYHPMSGPQTDFGMARIVSVILESANNPELVKGQKCPTTKPGETFEIGKKLRELEEAYKLEYPEHREPVQEVEIRPLSIPQCSSAEMIKEFKAVEAHFSDPKQKSSFWFGHEKDACRFQASVQRLKHDGFSVRFIAARAGDPVPEAREFATFEKLYETFNGVTKRPETRETKVTAAPPIVINARPPEPLRAPMKALPPAPAYSQPAVGRESRSVVR